MKQYRLTERGYLRTDTMTIPNDPANMDYQRVLAEIAAGEAQAIPYVAPADEPEQPNLVAEARDLLKAGDVKGAITKLCDSLG